MDTETHAAALTVTTAIFALEQAGGQCSVIETHVEQPSGQFLHLEATVQFSRMPLPVDTSLLCDCPEPTHWLMLAQHLQYLAAQFAALSRV